MPVSKPTLQGYWVANHDGGVPAVWLCLKPKCGMAAKLEGYELRPCPPFGLPSGCAVCRVCKRRIGKRNDESAQLVLD